MSDSISVRLAPVVIGANGKSAYQIWLGLGNTGTEQDFINSLSTGGNLGVTALNGRKGDVTITAADVGLANVNNTSDANKPVSTATTQALSLKVDKVDGKQLTTIDFTQADKTKLDSLTPGGGSSGVTSVNGQIGAVQLDPEDIGAATAAQGLKADTAVQPASLTKANVGLSNVDNTSDAGKPVSTAQASALALKAPLASPSFTGTVTGITATMVGLGNVDNTSDANKPVSSATTTALNLKAPIASPTFTGTVSGITATMVGLGNVTNTSDANKPVSTAQQTALDLKANLASPTFTGTVGGITKTMVGLSNVDNTADTAKPISTAQQSALDLKAPLASPTFTGTVSGVTKAMVGLANVDNTSDANKPVSTAQALANNKPNTVTTLTTTGGVVNIDCSLGDFFILNLTANVTSITFSNLPAAGFGTSKAILITQNATTAYTVAWSASFRWGSDGVQTVSTALGAKDLLGITMIDNTKWDATLSKGRV